MLRLFLCRFLLGPARILKRDNAGISAQQLLQTPPCDFVRQRQVLDALRICGKYPVHIRTRIIDHTPRTARQLQRTVMKDRALTTHYALQGRGRKRVENGIAHNIDRKLQIEKARTNRQEIRILFGRVHFYPALERLVSGQVEKSPLQLRQKGQGCSGSRTEFRLLRLNPPRVIDNNAHRSISPSTMSIDPITATTSAISRPSHMACKACRLAKDGFRMCTR